MNDTYIVPEVFDVSAQLPPEDDVPALEESTAARKKEGKADDIIAMQAVICLLIAAGLAVSNIFVPDTAEGIFSRLKSLSESTNELFPNPIELIAEHFG